VLAGLDLIGTQYNFNHGLYSGRLAFLSCVVLGAVDMPRLLFVKLFVKLNLS
jgi:hypothetical protein